MNAKHAGLVPLLVVLASLLVFILSFYPEQNLSPNLIFNLPAPFSSAYAFLLSISALVVAFFFARGFLSSGSLYLITLGSGSLILGLGFLLSQILGSAPFGGPNQLTGISSLVFLASGVFYSASVTLSLVGKTVRLEKSALALLVGYAGSIALVIVAIVSVEMKFTPDFFVSGVGPTLLRQQVLGAAIVLFAYASVVLMRNYTVSEVSILYWFSLGLAAIAVGFLSAFLGKVPGGPFSWLGRISLIVGGIYFVVSISQSYKGSEAKMSQETRPNADLQLVALSGIASQRDSKAPFL